MKISRKSSLLLLISGFCFGSIHRLSAQSFTTLHSFSATPSPGYTNSDGRSPQGGLVSDGNTLYGTAFLGGPSLGGTVFAVTVDGTHFTTLHGFATTSGLSYTNSDGAGPLAALVLSGETLYGTTSGGGDSGGGTIFSLRIDGTKFTTLHSFTATGDRSTNGDGRSPQAGLILSENRLFGTTVNGGTSGGGTIFAINRDGTGFTNLHSLAPNDGVQPYGQLALSGNTLFGTMSTGGAFSAGTVFSLNDDGTGFKRLYSFSFESGGFHPLCGLIVSGNSLYGTAFYGGSSGFGTVFALSTDGARFTTLHNFNEGLGAQAGLILAGDRLYGTTVKGGSSFKGTVFEVNTDGTGYKTLHNFPPQLQPDDHNSDGANPDAPLTISGNTLYGTANFGGSSGNGTIFSLSLDSTVAPPPLTIIRSQENVVLTWPTNPIGFSLQSTTNLLSSAFWNTVSQSPTVVNAQNSTTIPISDTQNFYRLHD